MFKKRLLYYLFVCVCMYCTTYMQAPQESRRGWSWSSKEMPCVCVYWELNLGLLREQLEL